MGRRGFLRVDENDRRKVLDRQNNDLELAERLRLIESMIAEGRRSTRKWGWTFVLWGIAYLVATAWATWDRSAFAWPVTMTVTVVLNIVIARRTTHGHPDTALGRAIGAVWIAMGSSLMTILVCLGAAGRYDGHVYVAIMGAMLATAHATSAMILKWKAQFWSALVWLAAGVAACFGSDAVVGIAFLGATLLGQVGFGIYAMILEARARKLKGLAHA
jgi:hypothetical protein